MTPSFAVRVLDPRDMHPAGLMVGRALARAARAGRPLPPLDGNLAIEVDEMALTLVPVPDGIEVALGRVEPVAVRVRAPLSTLLRVVRGGSLVGALARGGLRASGGLRALYRARSLLALARVRP